MTTLSDSAASHPRFLVLAILLVVLAGALEKVGDAASPSSQEFFEIAVLDEQTERGIPLVRLTTVNKVDYWTDSGGRVAFHEPGLMGEEVYFHVDSPGYVYPKDGFGNRGTKLRPLGGQKAVLKLTRLNIAERLYRVTGQGIYRDTVLLGRQPPTKQPLLNGLVFGQDTVIATPYRGKIYWFWGDTDRAAYPLGNFAASGATSVLPSGGGLDPGGGVDLTYFVDRSGFSKQMCPDFGPGLHWIEGVFTVPDETGRERLVARVASQRGLEPAYAWHLAVFDDEKSQFVSKVRWELTESHDSSHSFRARVGTNEYLYLYPNYRVRRDLASLTKLDRYEAFTCLNGVGDLSMSDATVDRDGAGRVRYSWKPGMKRLDLGRVKELTRRGRIKPEESWLHLIDLETGRKVPDGRGSVFWNEYRRRWIMIVSGKPGDIWFAEADTPAGPWAYAKRVLTHADYNFYNPTQHPFFDQAGGRIIYFEGTYTASFSGAKTKTPRYDYNQLMYRLSLDDARLDLPAPVYRLRAGNGGEQLRMREEIARDNAWDRILGVAFYAVPPQRGTQELLPVFRDDQSNSLSLKPSASNAVPFFFAPRPVSEDPANSKTVVDVWEFRDRELKRSRYSTEAESADPGETRSEKPVCKAWRNPLSVLALDPVG